MGLLKGIGMVMFLFLSCAFGSLWITFPLLPLIWLSPRLRRKLADWSCGVWCRLPPFLFGRVFGVQFRYSGDPLPENEAAILLSNHPSRLDWMFLWDFVARIGTIRREKIFLKDGLKKAPFFGWAMQSFCFLFLKRSWESDAPYITRAVDHLLSYQLPYQFLLFAEGTDLSPSNLQKDQEFATERKLKVYQHLLHPRTRGWEHMLQLTRGPVPAVYDITIGYVGLDGYLTEKGLLKGRLPREIHVHVQRYDLKSLPTDATESGQWLKALWDAKEDRLAKFYASSPHSFASGATPLSSQLAAKWASSDATSALCAFFWAALVVVSFYCLFTSAFFRWYSLFAVLSMYAITKFFGGQDELERRFSKNPKTRKP